MSDPPPSEFVEPEAGACEVGTWSFIGGFKQIEGAIRGTGGGVCPGGTPNAWVNLDPGDPGGLSIPIGDGCGVLFVHYRELNGICEVAGFSVFEKNEQGEIDKPPLYQAGSGALAFQGHPMFSNFADFDYSPTKSIALCTGEPQFCAVAEGTQTVLWEQFDPEVALNEEQEPVLCGPNGVHTCSVLRAHRHGDDDQSCERHLDWVVRKL